MSSARRPKTKKKILAPESNKAKGNLIEEIVALLHEGAGGTVERNVKLPVKGNPRRRREIDVLLTTNVFGYQVQLAFECKNLKDSVEVDSVGTFRDRLEEVGIPPQLGFIVSASGFTEDALDRAAALGIRTLLVSGLTPDRIATEISAAFQAVVFLLLDVDHVTLTTDVAEDTHDEMLILVDEAGELEGFVQDLIWAQWRDGKIPFSLGQYRTALELPDGWRFALSGDTIPTRAEALVSILGLVILIEGQAEHFVLREARSGAITRQQVRVRFETGPKTYSVLTVRSEEELQAIMERPATVKATVGRLPLPRIRFKIYWPPSERALQRMTRLVHEAVKRRTFHYKPSYEEIEGTDLAAIWEPVARSHPSVTDPGWPWSAERHGR